MRVLQGQKQEFASLRGGGPMMILAFADMMSTSSLKGKLGKTLFIEMISGMIDQCE